MPSDIDIFQLSEGLLKKVTGTNYVISDGRRRPPKKSRPAGLIFQVVLDDLNDFGNIGTIVRTCHAFGIDSIISTTKDIDPLPKKKQSMPPAAKVFDSSFRCFESPENDFGVSLRAKQLSNNNNTAPMAKASSPWLN